MMKRVIVGFSIMECIGYKGCIANVGIDQENQLVWIAASTYSKIWNLGFNSCNTRLILLLLVRNFLHGSLV